MGSLADQFRRLFEYERDSHAKVLRVLAAVPERGGRQEAMDQARMLVAHIVAARQLWLRRLGEPEQEPAEFFPRGLTGADLAERVRKTESVWSRYLAQLDDAELARIVEYRSQEGEWYHNSVQDILTQLYGHSLYHRGQIAALVRSLGCDPAVTDYIFWTRELIPEPMGVPGSAPVETRRGG